MWNMVIGLSEYCNFSGSLAVDERVWILACSICSGCLKIKINKNRKLNLINRQISQRNINQQFLYF